MDELEEQDKLLIHQFVINEPKKFTIKLDQKEFSCILLLSGPDSGGIQVVSNDLQSQYVTNDTFNLEYLQGKDGLFMSYLRLEEIMEDLASACAKKEIKIEFVEDILQLKMKIQFNRRIKYLVFDLQQQDMQIKDKNEFLVQDNIDLRKQILLAQKKWELVQQEGQDMKDILEQSQKEVEEQDKEKENPVIKQFQYLLCYQCGSNKSGEMTICVNEQDPNRNDTYGKDGYTACCPKETCQAKIGQKKYYAKKVGGKKTETKEKKEGDEEEGNVLLKYQHFKCYSCGAKKDGEMTICKNTSDPGRNDEYGKNGYTACCPKESCLKMITKKPYFNESVGKPMDIVKKYQWFQCYQCGAKKDGEMTICANKKDPSRNDTYGKDGYTGCCPKSSCQAQIGKKEYYKQKIGTPKEKVVDLDLTGLTGDDLIIMKYQHFKCYQCGVFNKGKMTICKNTSDPNRNDEYGKDGYTGCCPKTSCLAKIGDKNYFKEKIGIPSEVGKVKQKKEKVKKTNNVDVVDKYQDLQCYQCGAKNEGKMTICQNDASPDRSDGYGRDGYTACCPKSSCQSKIGVAKFFAKKIESDFTLKYQDLKCYQCGDKKNGQMTICNNGRDPKRSDEYGRDGYSACCPKETCQKKIGEADFFKGKALKKPEEQVEALEKYQILKCYKCGSNDKGRMTVCINRKDPETQDEWRRDGFTACCVKEVCQKLIGKIDYFKETVQQVIHRFQKFKCYQCGSVEEDKMTICKNEKSPDRDDEYGKDGFSVCCPKESCQKLVGVGNQFQVLIGRCIGHKDFQKLKCYQCGDQKNGKMTICKNGSDPLRNDEYGKSGYVVCCPKTSCQVQIGVKKYYKVIYYQPNKEENEENVDDGKISVMKKYQYLKCYQCGDKKEGDMTICVNGQDKDRNDEYGKDGYTACCKKESCQKQVKQKDYFKEPVKDIIQRYQDLKCYQCGDANSGKLSICKNLQQPDRNDGFGKDGYTALCPKEACQKFVGTRNENKVHMGGPEDL